MKTIPVLILSFLIISLSGLAQVTIPQVKQNVLLPDKAVQGVIDKKVILEAQPKVIVTTIEVRNITATTATCSYSIKFDGLTMGVDIKASSSGVCISKGPGPTINNTKFGISKDCYGSAIGCSDMTNLTPNMKFYVRAFYTITQGTITGTFYGNELSFTTLQPAK